MCWMRLSFCNDDEWCFNGFTTAKNETETNQFIQWKSASRWIIFELLELVHTVENLIRISALTSSIRTEFSGLFTELFWPFFIWEMINSHKITSNLQSFSGFVCFPLTETQIENSEISPVVHLTWCSMFSFNLISQISISLYPIRELWYAQMHMQNKRNTKWLLLFFVWEWQDEFQQKKRGENRVLL